MGPTRWPCALTRCYRWAALIDNAQIPVDPPQNLRHSGPCQKSFGAAKVVDLFFRDNTPTPSSVTTSLLKVPFIVPCQRRIFTRRIRPSLRSTSQSKVPDKLQLHNSIAQPKPHQQHSFRLALQRSARHGFQDPDSWPWPVLERGDPTSSALRCDSQRSGNCRSPFRTTNAQCRAQGSR